MLTGVLFIKIIKKKYYSLTLFTCSCGMYHIQIIENVSCLWNEKKGKLEPLLNVQNKLRMCDEAEQNKRQ